MLNAATCDILLEKGFDAVLEVQPVPDDVRARLLAVWTEEARTEHASIAAFAKLSLELLALGAPPDLILRANRAAIQEVEHARLCFAVANAYGGDHLAPGPLTEALVGDTMDLFRVAREALIDGCIGEGVAAEIARLGAERARDPVVARVMRVQARDEAQHAALAWAIVDWCLPQGGEALRRTLLASLREAQMPRCEDLPEHGRVPTSAVQPFFDGVIAEARARLEARSVSPSAARRAA